VAVNYPAGSHTPTGRLQAYLLPNIHTFHTSYSPQEKRGKAKENAEHRSLSRYTVFLAVYNSAEFICSICKKSNSKKKNGWICLHRMPGSFTARFDDGKIVNK